MSKRRTQIVLFTMLIFTILVSTNLFTDQILLKDTASSYNKSVTAGPVPTTEGHSYDVALEEQYITAIEGYRMIQHVVFVDGGSDTFPIRIDSFTVTNTGWLSDYDVTGIQLWADGGNGYFDGGGSPPRADDVQIGSTIYNPSFKHGQIIGEDDGVSCCTIENGESLSVFLTLDLYEGCVWNNLEIPTQIDATDLTALSSSNWSKFQGIETSTNHTKTYGVIMTDEIAIHDTNTNGIVDQLHITTQFPLGPVQSITHKANENHTIDKFTVYYDGDEIDILDILLLDSDANTTTFSLVLDESDLDIYLDTTADEFSVEYWYIGGDFRYLSADNREVRLFEIKDTFLLTDAAGPIVTDIDVSHETIAAKHSGEIFTVELDFSEEMNTSIKPEIVYNGTLQSDFSSILDSINSSWLDSNTLQVNYTILEADVFCGEVDVVMTGNNTYDTNGVQMTNTFVIEDCFYVDMKAPIISDFPSDELIPGQDYTIRVSVEDYSEVDLVMLDYDFGSNLNTKMMTFDPGSAKYVSVVTVPLDATNLSYRVSAYDIYDNAVISSFHLLNTSADIDETNETDSTEDDEGAEDETDDSSQDSSEDEDETDTDDSNAQNQTDDSSQESTPGFEIILIFIACAFLVFVYKKRK